VVLFAVVAAATAKPHLLVSPAVETTLVKSAAVVPVVQAAPLTATVVEKKHTVEHVPVTTLKETVHYADTPVVTGHTSTILKPDLGALATPIHTVSQTPVIAPARTVAVPEITQVHTVDLVKTGHAVALPAVATHQVVAAPAIATHQVAAVAPAVTSYSTAVTHHVPAVTHQVVSSPVATHHISAVPVATHQVVGAPAVTTYTAGIHY